MFEIEHAVAHAQVNQFALSVFDALTYHVRDSRVPLTGARGFAVDNREAATRAIRAHGQPHGAQNMRLAEPEALSWHAPQLNQAGMDAMRNANIYSPCRTAILYFGGTASNCKPTDTKLPLEAEDGKIGLEGTTAE